MSHGLSAAKDLYDAVLLAELPEPRLTDRLRRHLPDPMLLRPKAVHGWNVDWSDFRVDHPSVRGTAAQWLERLVAALEPIMIGDLRA